MYTRAVVYNRLYMMSRGIMGNNCAQFRNRRRPRWGSEIKPVDELGGQWFVRRYELLERLPVEPTAAWWMLMLDIHNPNDHYQLGSESSLEPDLVVVELELVAPLVTIIGFDVDLWQLQLDAVFSRTNSRRVANDVRKDLLLELLVVDAFSVYLECREYVGLQVFELAIPVVRDLDDESRWSESCDDEEQHHES